MDGNRPFFDRVESLRGLGAMAVAGVHFSGCVLNGITLLPQVPWLDCDPIQRFIGQLGLFLMPGRAAVMAFFVISGFVLRVSLEFGPQDYSRSTAKFLTTRFFRVFPIVTLIVCLTALTCSEALDAGWYISNLLLFDVSMNKHLWAIQVEVLMIPVILALYFLERRWGEKVLAVVAVVTTGLIFIPDWAIWPSLSGHLFAFVLGMLAPTYGRQFATKLPPRSANRWLAVSLAIILTAGPVLGEYSKFTIIAEAYISMAAISIVAYRSDLRVLKGLDSRWLRTLGSASGSYYVLHMSTVPIAMALASGAVPGTWSAAAPGAVGVGVIALWLVAIAPVMVVVSRLVEMPGIALGRRVVRLLRLDSRPRTIPIGVPILERKAA